MTQLQKTKLESESDLQQLKGKAPRSAGPFLLGLRFWLNRLRAHIEADHWFGYQSNVESELSTHTGSTGLVDHRSDVERNVLPAMAAIGGLAGATTLVYFVGGTTLWLRLHAAGITADDAIGYLPTQSILTVGIKGLALPVFVAILALAFVVWNPTPTIESVDTETGETNRTPTRYWSFVFKFFDGVGSLANRVKNWWRRGPAQTRVAHTVLAPFRWYFEHVPFVLWAWLPLIIFFPDPVGTLLVFIPSTAIGVLFDQIGMLKSTSRSLSKIASFALAIFVLFLSQSILLQWHDPKPLPDVSIVTRDEPTRHAKFVSISGEQLYVAWNHALVAVPMSSVESIWIHEAPRSTRVQHNPSVLEYVF